MQRQTIRKLINARAPDSSLKDIARALVGLYADIAAECAWPLRPASAIDAPALSRRLTRALAVPVNEVLFASVSQPYADAAWATDEGYDLLFSTGLAAALEASVERDFAWTYWGRLQLSLERPLLAGIGEQRLDILERDVRARVMTGLRSALFSSLAGPLSVRMVEECVFSVEETLRGFLAFTVMDDRMDGVPLGHLTRIMTGAIPLGAKRGEPGTWIAVTA
ncbi:MAG TPA: hypothetical protein VL426_00780 [Candidatus Binatia bacterium]|nr:hypothetical protein [Candidatus Binatia bacterium]